MLAVETSELKKSFDKAEAVRGVNFRINKGDLFGLIGPDGAGKTTLIRLLTGVMTPDSGSIKIFGTDAVKRKAETGMMIGYMPQRFSLYEELTVDENLKFFASLRSVERTNFIRQKDYLLKFTNLEPFTKRLAGKLSGGMKQKLGLACTLIHQPQLLILDEPTTGVDPVSRREFWQILDSFLHQGMTVLMSTPYMDEADRCTTIALMNNGIMPVVDTPQNIKILIKGTMLEAVVKEPLHAKQILNVIDNYRHVHILGDRIHIYVDKQDPWYITDVKQILNNNGIAVEQTGFTPPTLEDVFVSIIEKERE
ncbi:MAG: ABC transporter ATP-binding protein [Deltaproteobacteria bacterium]|nr:ABC transporter ATP-binding protein [Deltaproteobacteria bacterium]MCL5792832.1 ABC transporter ATP-binding protein [Deltaproteobacteria bacterium]